MTDRKPTYDTVMFEFEEPVNVDQFTIGSDGAVQMMSGGKVLTPITAMTGRHRERSTGREKTLFSFPSSAFATEGELLSSFPFVFTVDTNSVRLGNEVVSVAMLAVSSITSDPSEAETAIMRTVHPGSFEFRGLERDQERLAWVMLQDAITGSPDFDPSETYLIITDHAKNLHGAINAGKETLFGDVRLAENITLGYATSDSGSSISQLLVRSCDAFSKRFLNDVRSGKVGKQGLRTVSNGPITSFRGIMNTRSSWPTGDYRRFRLSADAPLERFEFS